MSDVVCRGFFCIFQRFRSVFPRVIARHDDGNIVERTIFELSISGKRSSRMPYQCRFYVRSRQADLRPSDTGHSTHIATACRIAARDASHQSSRLPAGRCRGGRAVVALLTKEIP
ncbi:hypothetical protein [Burkholderia sp. lig30]|jgi:hypothetical protein|uniref:hypothetical protein n=1 Tax=Burkholderia sp. lig30 TaxID=1192124 RepID=UPI00128F6A2D|nr:hypothetical protein [Burkholderia sp. lig30]